MFRISPTDILMLVKRGDAIRRGGVAVRVNEVDAALNFLQELIATEQGTNFLRRYHRQTSTGLGDLTETKLLRSLARDMASGNTVPVRVPRPQPTIRSTAHPAHASGPMYGPQRVVWSAVERPKPDPNVDERIKTTIQRLADVSGSSFQLSSGYRPHQGYWHIRRMAIDINMIDGIDIGTGSKPNPDAMGLVLKVQTVAKTFPEIRENFGPAGLWKSEGYGQEQKDYFDGSQKRTKLKMEHMNHIHISVHSQ